MWLTRRYGRLDEIDNKSILLLLIKHYAKSSISQEERLATALKLVAGLHLPHAIAAKLHVRQSNVVILTPETVVTVGIWAVAHHCR